MKCISRYCLLQRIGILALLASYLSCAEQVQVELKEVKIVDQIPSSSGIGIYRNGYFVIGDDSPYLYRLARDLSITEKILLTDSTLLTNARVRKEDKPDFEALEVVADKELIIFGSGSKSPQRDIVCWLSLLDTAETRAYPASKFYDRLRTLEVMADSELNLEAAVYKEGVLYLFNRRKNVVFSMDYSSLLGFLEGDGELPEIHTRIVDLPSVRGVEAGFSGAVALQGQPRILFTASIEDTDNAYDDGAVLGSIIGYLDLTEEGDVGQEVRYCVLGMDSPYALKIESIAIEVEHGASSSEVVLVADNDDGKSRIARATVVY